MQLNIKLAAAITIVAVSVAAGFYILNTKQADQVQPETTGQQDTGLPSGHPVIGQGNGAQEPGKQSGKVQVDQNATFTRFGVGNSNVKSIFADGKVVWVGTSGGVIRYNTGTDDYHIFNVTNGLLSNGVFNVTKLGKYIAVGTYGGGLSLYDQELDTWENLNVPNGLADAFVYKTLKVSNGDIWIATWSGANRVRGGDLKDRSKWEVYTVENTDGGLPNDWVYSLEEGKNGEIWLATEGGLARFKDDKWQNWNHAKGVGAPYEIIKNDPQFGIDPANFSEHHAKQKKEMGLGDTGVAFNPNYIVSMVVDHTGVVWCGTWGGGLSRFDGKKWRHYTMADGLPGNHVFALHEDPSGKLWVGTNNGLASFDSGKFSKAMTTDDGLYSNTIFSMTTSPDGSQWIGSFGGVTHLSAAK